MMQSHADPVLLANNMAELADKRIDILRRIKECGSISEAARRAGVSYKAAWQAIETLGNLAGGPLVEKVVGGANGGGSRLTSTGEEVLMIADELTRARAEVLARFRLKDNPQLRNIGMSTLRTSLANQFPATIVQMKQGSALVRLTLDIVGHRLRATTTMKSAQLLGLKQDKHVLAMCKATSVEISAPEKLTEGARDNLLVGVVMRCDREHKGGECTIQIAPSLSIIGFARRDHGLHIGDTAIARIAPSSIVVAVNS